VSACTCRNCGPVGAKTSAVEVTITIARVRAGWEQTGYGTVWGEVETEHELRASVSYGSVDDEPEVAWLDQAVVDDLELAPHELVGAEEQAAEAGYMQLRGELTEQDHAEERADRAYQERRDEELLGRAS
jgi:hypothetical protein